LEDLLVSSPYYLLFYASISMPISNYKLIPPPATLYRPPEMPSPIPPESQSIIPNLTVSALVIFI
jgi:hypothetical protein